MPTKTDRILSYLPGTFRALPKPTALYAVADAFGNELLLAENSLAAILLSHWIDHADRGAETITDLSRIGALYGLAPRRDSLTDEVLESVEEFREHLKRYIRTFLEGTATVPGILRVTAEALGLRIADDQFESWWKHPVPELVTQERRGEDAAELVLGITDKTMTGQAATAAHLQGTVDLSTGADLRQAHILRLQVDGANPVAIDLLTAASDAAAVSLIAIRDAINTALGQPVATLVGNNLSLTSPTLGAASRLEVWDTANDAAELVLGLRSRTAVGSTAKAARVVGNVDLSQGVLLESDRYIRLTIDGTRVAEIDCTAGSPGLKSLAQICTAINQALGVNVALHNNQVLSLISPTIGANSSIAFQAPTAQDATALLFGTVQSFYLGQDTQPARMKGTQDLQLGVDLSDRPHLRLQIDNAASVTVNCAGTNPAQTQAAEIVAALNTAFRIQIASFDGRALTLISPTQGTTSSLTVELLPGGDAAEAILGIRARIAEGTDATPAQLVGIPDLRLGTPDFPVAPADPQGKVNLRARHLLSLAVDGGSPVEIDLRSGAADAQQVRLTELTAAINSQVGQAIASQADGRLVFTSLARGSASSLTLAPLETRRSRRFVTRAMITDEATQAILGFMSREAVGTSGKSARLVGTVDLHRGVDLRETPYLRIQLDDRPPQEVNCALNSPRPRAALLNEIVAAINQQMGLELASQDGRRLVLTSPLPNASSRIVLQPSQAADALSLLFDSVLAQPVSLRGQDADRIKFVSTVNLNGGIDLPAGAAIKLSLDGAAAVEIALAPQPGRKTIGEIVSLINVALLKPIATQDGSFITLTSPSLGSASQIGLELPSGTDVTAAVLGVSAPRSYQGRGATQAQVVGRAIAAPLNLSVRRYLRLSINGGVAVDVDCAATAADATAVTLEQVVSAINAVIPGLATAADHRLHLTTPTLGSAGQIALAHYTGGDARTLLLGAIAQVQGADPAPAVITGEVDLLRPVNLQRRQLFRLAVDGSRPVDIDVSGAADATTFLDEIIAAINQVFPGVAAASPDDRLQLTSPTPGEHSRLAVLPLRYLEMVEYPATVAQFTAPPVGHGDRWTVVNSGAATVAATIQIHSLAGIVGATIVNSTLGWQVRLLATLAVGDTASLWIDPQGGLRAEIRSAQGITRTLPSSDIWVGLVGSQTWVPFSEERFLTDDGESPVMLQLNHPLAQRLVRLQARLPEAELVNLAQRIGVGVTESDLSLLDPPSASDNFYIGRIRQTDGHYRLVDAHDTAIATLPPSAGINLEPYRDRVVQVTGLWHSGTPPLLMVQSIAALFDVTLRHQPTQGDLITETYRGVTIGEGATNRNLVRQINSAQPSQLVKAEELDKATVLTLPQGKSDWVFLDCYGSRFNHAQFNYARFAGGICRDRGVFNLSRFSQKSCEEQPGTCPEPIVAAFTTADAAIPPTAAVTFTWDNHQPGEFQVNLPLDLPAQFGARFNQTRFSLGADPQAKKLKPEVHPNIVVEPLSDADYLGTRLNAQSSLITVSPNLLFQPPLGWAPVTLPFRKPIYLTLGKKDAPAALYLAGEGISGVIELKAKYPGVWGNEVAVAVRKTGPALYEVSILYKGARFENARQVALGDPLPALVQENLKPGAIGVLQAKAAGVKAAVGREGCRDPAP